MIKKTKEHLNMTNESYTEHMRIALNISFQLLLGALMAFMHALIPSLFSTGASKKIKNLYSFIEDRNRNN